MSGGVAAHAAFNGSGTQGLAVTNKVDAEEGDVMSVFWNSNDTTRQLLHGSSFTEVHASAGSGTNTFAQSNSHVFDINNDIDCLGDLVLGVTVNHNGQIHPTQAFSHGPAEKITHALVGDAAVSGEFSITPSLHSPHSVNPHDLVSIISRVELMVGTQIWQTLESADILALLSTECSSGVYEEYTFQTSGGVQGGKHINNGPNTSGGFFPTEAAGRADVMPGGTTDNMFKAGTGSGLTGSVGHSESVSHTAYIPLKSFTKTLGPVLANFSTQTEDGYLMAAAPHQQVKVRVFTAPLSGAGTSRTPLNKFSHSGDDAMTVNLALYAKNIIMCNEEREHMRAMPMGLPKRIKMTQNATKTAGSTAGTTTLHTPGTGFTDSLEHSGGTNFALDMDLDHFSLFASHLLISIESPTPQNTDPVASGVHPGGGFTDANLAKLNGLTAELLLNSTSFSGKLPLGLLKMNSSSMGLHSNEYLVNGKSKGAYVTFVFPLAAIAYGGSSVPLNRFDNIRLRLSGDANGSGVSESTTISVTCCGETTALYKNGAASLAMY